MVLLLYSLRDERSVWEDERAQSGRAKIGARAKNITNRNHRRSQFFALAPVVVQPTLTGEKLFVKRERLLRRLGFGTKPFCTLTPASQTRQ